MASAEATRLGDLRDWVARGGCIGAERYVWADIRVRPYQFHKLDGAKRLSLFDEDTFSTAPNGLFVQTHRVGWFTGLCGAERLRLCRHDALGRIYKSAPTILWNVCLIEGAATAGHTKAVCIVSFAYGLAPAIGGA